MSIPDRVVRRPIATLAIVTLVLLIGMVSLWKTPLDLLPDIKPPLIAIITVFPGSSPQETLKLITEPIEGQVSAIGGVTNLSSLSQENISMVLLRFHWGSDLNSMRDEVNARLDLLSFPDGVRRPIILKFDPTLLPVMQVAVSSGEDAAVLTDWLNRNVKTRLEKIPGVASAGVQGGAQQGLFVRLDPALAVQNRVSFDQVANILMASLLDLPAGITELDQQQLRLRFLGRPADIDALKNLVIGFHVDDQLLQEALGQSINLNLNERFSSAFSVPALSDVPMKTIYVKDVAKNIRLNERGSAIIIEPDHDLLEQINLQPRQLLALLPLEWNPDQERGNIVISLPPGSKLDWEHVENIALNQIPDFNLWLEQIQEQVGEELDSVSHTLEQSLTEMAAMMITASAMPGGGPQLPENGFPLQPVTLGSIAEVEVDLHRPSTLNRVNGQPSVSLFIQKEGDANTVTVSRQVRQTLQEIAGAQSGQRRNISFHPIYDQARDIENALADLAWALAGGSFLAVAVLLIFLRNWRTVVIIGLSIPMAVISTFALLYFANLTINLMTLGALALAAGMLVDNAIIVSENIYRHYQMGEDPVEAAVSGSNEVSGAILASTLTTISVFFPVAFISGLARELFRDFSLTVVIALLASLIIALTVIPLLASRLLSRKRVDHRPAMSRESYYHRLLKRALRYPWAVVSVGVLFVALSLLLYPMLGMNLFPASDESSFYIDITLPAGTPLQQTDQVVSQVEHSLTDLEQVSHFSAQVGETQFFGLPLEGGTANKARVRIHVKKEWADRMEAVIHETRDRIEPLLEEAHVIFTRESLLDTTGLEMKLELTVEGETLAGVNEISAELVKRLEQVPAVTDVHSLLEETRPELHAHLEHSLALQKGMTVYQTATLLRQALEGMPVARLETEQGILDLILCYSESSIKTLSDLEQIGLYATSGAYMQLGHVATFSEGYGPTSIPRENQRMVGMIRAQYRDDLGSVSTEAMQIVEEMQLPPGYEVRITGTASLMRDVFDELELVLILAALLVYLVMSAQFESLLHPFIIICSLPLAFGGSIIALLLTGNSLNVPAFIGAVVLAGILVNDGIIMVDFINQQRRLHNIPLHEAIIAGATARLRPILMTTITTILGLVPLALALGQGSQLQAPMAIVIIGGQITGTALLLVVIPAIYRLVTRE